MGRGDPNLRAARHGMRTSSTPTFAPGRRRLFAPTRAPASRRTTGPNKAPEDDCERMREFGSGMRSITTWKRSSDEARSKTHEARRGGRAPLRVRQCVCSAATRRDAETPHRSRRASHVRMPANPCRAQRAEERAYQACSRVSQCQATVQSTFTALLSPPPFFFFCRNLRCGWLVSRPEDTAKAHLSPSELGHRHLGRRRATRDYHKR